jgi:hypothetical protein
MPSLLLPGQRTRDPSLRTRHKDSVSERIAESAVSSWRSSRSGSALESLLSPFINPHRSFGTLPRHECGSSVFTAAARHRSATVASEAGSSSNKNLRLQQHNTA